MRSKSLVFLLFYLLPVQASPSLFFTAEEIEAIQHSVVDQKTSNSSDNLSLSAILYIHPTQWTLWINGKTIRSGQALALGNFHLEEVTPHKVRFSWHPSQASPPLPVTLRPGQKFLAHEKKIVDPENSSLPINE